MLPRNHITNSTRFLLTNLSSTSSVYHLSIATKQQQTRRRQKTTTTVTHSRSNINNNTITISSFVSVNTSNVTISPSTSTSSTQQQQISFEDSYSPKTGIKTAALLGGMLVLVIFYLLWKARARLCRQHRSSTANMNNARLSATKFDLDYWLKQVDLLEAKEVERNRGGQSLYLELPKQEPRDNRQATASWIVDAYRHWRLLQYRRQEHLFRPSTDLPQSETTPYVPYRRRRHLMRRLFRRFFSSSRHNHSLFAEHSSSLLAGVRRSIASNNINLSPLFTANVPVRRANSWPYIKSARYSPGTSMSALQTHLTRKGLLNRNSRPKLEI